MEIIEKQPEDLNSAILRKERFAFHLFILSLRLTNANLYKPINVNKAGPPELSKHGGFKGGKA